MATSYPLEILVPQENTGVKIVADPMHMEILVVRLLMGNTIYVEQVSFSWIYNDLK
jgi:hypothetical protein